MTNLITKKTNIDQQLEEAIDPWLAHMRWRSDFASWREGRLWQEKKQKQTLDRLRLFLKQGGLQPLPGESDVLAGRNILDLGCGMGGLTTALALAGAKVQSLDYNPAYCKITRLRGKRYDFKFAPVNAAGEYLPFPDAHFDIIVCMDVLEHVQNPEKLVAEVARCLKPKGICYLTAINRFAFNDPHYHVRLVNWLPRRFAEPYLKFIRRQKDNSRFTDRQTLREMHYYPYNQLAKLGARHKLGSMAELGELNLKKRQSGWKGIMQKARLLLPLYKIYRSYYKGTYQLMFVKEG
jgi:2-polyprenyl-3-methyl-5-hydroxy-6-metoxy-1,4-benzoquinol methylase